MLDVLLLFLKFSFASHVKIILYCFGFFVQNSEQFKILLTDGPLIGSAAAEVMQVMAASTCCGKMLEMRENLYFKAYLIYYAPRNVT